MLLIEPPVEDQDRPRRHLERLKKLIAGEATPFPCVPREEPKNLLGAAVDPPPIYFAAELAKLKATCPAKVHEKRWQQAVSDARHFLAVWGGLAVSLGWEAEDLFGLHPAAPLARYDAMGLIWMLHGREVVGIDKMAARIQATSGGWLTFRKKERS
jgi:hypothetical protein